MAYRERISVPLRWWVQGTMLVASLWLAVAVAAPLLVSAVVALVAMALLVAVFTAMATRVSVDPTVLRAGRAHISRRHLGAAIALDAAETRRVAGVDADARAYLLLRPWLKRSVRVEVRDPADPAPYWLIGSKRPEALAHALSTPPTDAPDSDPDAPPGR